MYMTIIYTNFKKVIIPVRNDRGINREKLTIFNERLSMLNALNWVYAGVHIM